MDGWMDILVFYVRYPGGGASNILVDNYLIIFFNFEKEKSSKNVILVYFKLWFTTPYFLTNEVKNFFYKLNYSQAVF